MLFKASSTIEPFYLGGPVSAVENTLATALDEKVILTNTETGQRLGSIDADGETVTALALTPDLQYLIIATQSLQIHIYSLETMKKVKDLPKAHDSPIMAMAVDPTSTIFATGGAEGAVKVWDIKGGYVTHNLRGHGGIISALKFYGKLGGSDWRLASGSDDTKVRVWDLSKSKTIAVLENHVNVVRAIDFSSQGDAILSAGRDKVISIYKDYKLIATFPVLEEVEAAGFIAGKYFYTGTASGVKLWNLAGEEVTGWSIPEECTNFQEVIDIVRVINSDNSQMKLIAVLSDQTLVELEVDPESDSLLDVTRHLAGNHGEVIDLAPTLIAKQPYLAIATNSHDIRLINPDKPLEFTPLVGHTDIVIAIDVMANWLVSAGKDKEARLWDLSTGECKIVFTGHAGSIGAVSLSRNSTVPKFVLTGSQDLTIKKWGPDGTADYTRKAHEKDINTIDVSNDNKLFASGSQDRTVKVWDVETGEVRGVLKGHRRGIWNIKFGNDQTILTGSGDKTVRMWNLHDFTALRSFEGHSNSVLKVAYLNNEFIASASGDGLVKVWDSKSSENVATLDNHEDKVWSLAVTNAGQLVSGGGDGVITMWEDYTEEDKARQEQEQEEQIEKQQDLENSIRNKEWDKAITLALELNHPFRLLKLFNEVAQNREPESVTGLIAVDEVLGSLEEKRLLKMLERVRDWNTNARTSQTAQTVLHAILRSHSVQNLSKPQIITIIGSILPYSQRHLARYDELLETSYTLDYALDEMSL